MLLIITPDEVLMLCISSWFSWSFNIYLIEKTTSVSGKSCWNCYMREETTGAHVIKKIAE